MSTAPSEIFRRIIIQVLQHLIRERIIMLEMLEFVLFRLIMTIFPSGPKLVTEREENERLNDAVQGGVLGEKGPRFKEMKTLRILFHNGIKLAAQQSAKFEYDSGNVNN